MTWNAIHTAHKKCEPVSDYIRFSLFSAENMKLEQTEHGQLQIIFADENKLSDRALKLTQEFSGGSLDVEDTECQLYLKFSENDITKAAIVLSLDAEPQKIANCLLVDFYRALGLSLRGDHSFKYAWSGGAEPLNKLNISAFPKLRKYISLLTYIHACPKLIAGMNKSQVETELTKNSICLKNLKGVDDGR